MAKAGVKGRILIKSFASQSPATLFVVQHVDKITESVRRQLRMNIEARRGRGDEAYCAFIDGIQTHKLLIGSRLKGCD